MGGSDNWLSLVELSSTQQAKRKTLPSCCMAAALCSHLPQPFAPDSIPHAEPRCACCACPLRSATSGSRWGSCCWRACSTAQAPPAAPTGATRPIT